MINRGAFVSTSVNHVKKQNLWTDLLSPSTGAAAPPTSPRHSSLSLSHPTSLHPRRSRCHLALGRACACSDVGTASALDSTWHAAGGGGAMEEEALQSRRRRRGRGQRRRHAATWECPAPSPPLGERVRERIGEGEKTKRGRETPNPRHPRNEPFGPRCFLRWAL